MGEMIMDDPNTIAMACDAVALISIEQLHPLGFDFISYGRGLKGPRYDDWQLKPKRTLRQLRAAWGHNGGQCNFGIRLGGWSKIGDRTLTGFDVDIRDPDAKDECHAWLDANLPEWRKLPSVISGSGGESRHLYCTFAVPPHQARTNLAEGEGWSVDLRGHVEGRGAQNVWPGSLHPDGGFYTFEREFDVAKIAHGLELADDLECHVDTGLEVSAEFEAMCFVKMGEKRSKVERDPDDIMGGPTGKPIEELRDTLDALGKPYWTLRASWLTAGMAIHHEFEGSDEGFDLWTEYSIRMAGADTEEDERERRKDWKSFADGNTANLIKFPTLIGEARDIRLKKMAEDIIDGGEDDDDEDLIGDLPVVDEEDMIGDLPTTSSTSAAPAAPEKKPDEPFTTEWLGRMVYGKGGIPRAGYQNTRLVMENDFRLKGIVGYDEFACRMKILKTPRLLDKKSAKGENKIVQLTGSLWKHKNTDDGKGNEWTDWHDDSIRAMIEAPCRTTGGDKPEFIYAEGQGGFGMKVAERDYKSALNLAAMANKFHPVREFLESETWDGEVRGELLFIKWLGCPDTPYYRDIARLTLLAAVTRIYEPGHKFDFVPILEGVQGKRKSTFIQVLAHHWFANLKGDFADNNKMIECMQEAWIMEIPELVGLGYSSVPVIKEFISTMIDKGRLAWAKYPGIYARQCIFIGTSNDDAYLRDTTGGRRFWPVECGLPEGVDIDTDGLKLWMPQVWAEMVALYKQMRFEKPISAGWLPLYLQNEESIAHALLSQEARRIENEEDVWLGQVQEWAEALVQDDDLGDEPGKPRKFFCAAQVAKECLGMERREYAMQSNSQKLGRVLGRLKNYRKNGKKHRFQEYGLQSVYHRLQHKQNI
jgi:hypothetical protein